MSEQAHTVDSEPELPEDDREEGELVYVGLESPPHAGVSELHDPVILGVDVQVGEEAVPSIMWSTEVSEEVARELSEFLLGRMVDPEDRTCKVARFNRAGDRWCALDFGERTVLLNLEV